MMRCTRSLNAVLVFFITLLATSAYAAEPTIADIIKNPNTKANKDYITFGLALNEFRSIEIILVESSSINFAKEEELVRHRDFPLTAQTYGMSIAYGTYITENFKTEVRYGTGLRDDTVDGAMDININYWFNWYIGASHPVTDYMSAYALYGVSFYEADFTRREISRLFPATPATTLTLQPSRFEMEDELFGTNFSTSWILGLDFHLIDEWFLAFEYGRLIKDTDTNIKVYQAGAYLRYEF